MGTLRDNLTPQNIPTTSFADKAQEYESTLAKRIDAEAAITQTEIAIRELFAKYEISIRFRSTDELLGQEDKLTIYRSVEAVGVDELVRLAARTEGKAFASIVSNPSVMKGLEEKFGAPVIDFLNNIDGLYHLRENQDKQEVDEEKTKELKDAYLALCSQLGQQKADLKKTEGELKAIREYLEFCKTLLQLGQGGGGKGQQQKGQQQAPKEE